MAAVGGKALLSTYFAVRDQGVPGVLYHVRFFGASTGEPLTPFSFVARTPQGDYYEELFSDARNQNILQAIGHCSVPGIAANQVHALDVARSVQQLSAWTPQWHAVVTGIVPGRRWPWEVDPPSANQVASAGREKLQVVALPAQGLPPAHLDVATDKFVGVLQWLLCESIGVYGYGSRVICPLPLEHFQIMRVAKLAFQSDQLDAASCAFIESRRRRSQTIEFGWAERIKDRKAKGMGSSRLSWKNQSMLVDWSARPQP